MIPDLLLLRDLAVAAARCGGDAALPHFRQPGLRVENKHDDSPVTIADRQAEAAIRAHIAAQRPCDAWLGEESGSAEGSSGLGWIVDPIDGTRNFVRGVPLWGTLVACARLQAQGDPEVLAAAVLFPALDEMYDAALGQGARCNSSPIQVSQVNRMADALWCFETPSWFRNNQLGAVFDVLEETCALSRGLCDAYGHMLVASGRAEIVVEPQLAMWDVAATSLIVREAGGSFSDLDGHQPGISSGHAVVSNGHLHAPTLDCIRRHRNHD